MMEAMSAIPNFKAEAYHNQLAARIAKSGQVRGRQQHAE
jgi:hypothetical protein